jgi:hypothetical protein
MQNALMQINLAYVLNAPAHVAMSYPSLRRSRPEDTGDGRFVELKAKLERLFREYQPPAEPSRAQSPAMEES